MIRKDKITTWKSASRRAIHGSFFLRTNHKSPALNRLPVELTRWSLMSLRKSLTHGDRFSDVIDTCTEWIQAYGMEISIRWTLRSSTTSFCELKKIWSTACGTVRLQTLPRLRPSHPNDFEWLNDLCQGCGGRIGCDDNFTHLLTTPVGWQCQLVVTRSLSSDLSVSCCNPSSDGLFCQNYANEWINYHRS